MNQEQTAGADGNREQENLPFVIGEFNLEVRHIVSTSDQWLFLIHTLASAR